MNLINFPSEGTRFNLIAASCAGEGKTHSHGKSALALCEPTGRRQARQFGKLYLLADGVGDHAAADVASRIAVETIPAVYYHRPGGYSAGLVASPGDVGSVAARLRQAFFAAHSRIRRLSASKIEYAGMATSCIAAVVRGSDLWVAHVGDCRAYLIRPASVSRRKIAHLTTDHSLVARLVQAGTLSAEQARRSPVRHILLQALGGWEGNDPSPDFAIREMRAGDYVVLCSGGIWSTVAEKLMVQVVGEMPPAQACAELVRLAEEAGSIDDNGVIILSFFQKGD